MENIICWSRHPPLAQAGSDGETESQGRAAPNQMPLAPRGFPATWPIAFGAPPVTRKVLFAITALLCT